jgi:hypothetical protein
LDAYYSTLAVLIDGPARYLCIVLREKVIFIILIIRLYAKQTIIGLYGQGFFCFIGSNLLCFLKFIDTIIDGMHQTA